jgi:ATP-dependent Clp protease ATP-binding subunit ClpC
LFERFTERARQIVVLAQQEARDWPSDHIWPVHLLVAVAAEDEGLGARVLASLDLTPERLRSVLYRDLPKDDATSGQLPFAPQAKKDLEGALRQALSLGHNYIGTEHILLALTKNHVLMSKLEDRTGATPERIRDQIMQVLAGPKQAVKQAEPTPPPERFFNKDEVKKIVSLAMTGTPLPVWPSSC